MGMVMISIIPSLSFARLPQKVNALYLPVHSVDLYRPAQKLPLHPNHTPGTSQQLPDCW